ncbi:MAG: sel1 repeat family protein, partial [Planctomycetes bacterium]|nr:sel1 repeat family protein [Planctomycetota bacterium]
LRDGKRARAIAQKALDRKETPSGLEAMAAACAETGDFDEAVRWQRKAIDHPKLADRGARDRLALYENKKPFRLD